MPIALPSFYLAHKAPKRRYFAIEYNPKTGDSVIWVFPCKAWRDQACAALNMRPRTHKGALLASKHGALLGNMITIW